MPAGVLVAAAVSFARAALALLVLVAECAPCAVRICLRLLLQTLPHGGVADVLTAALSCAGLLADAPCPVNSLPLALLSDVLERLPADARARAATVCRRWREAVADPALWRRLDLSKSSGVTCRVDAAALSAAAARARGGLQVLLFPAPYILAASASRAMAALAAVAAANSGSLREVHILEDPRCLEAWMPEYWLVDMLRAAPSLPVVDTSAVCTSSQARRLLRNEPPFGPLRVRNLLVWPAATDELNASELAADLGAHQSLTGLGMTLEYPGIVFFLEGALDTLVDAALALRLKSVTLDCRFLQADAPALARLLRGSLTSLSLMIKGPFVPEVGQADAGALVLADALRANTTLTSLLLASPLHMQAEPTCTLLRALLGHPCLPLLVLRVSGIQPAICAALGELVAANAPALEEIVFLGTALDAATWWASLAPLCVALPYNTHLRRLRISCAPAMGETFARTRLLPAVRANTSLRELWVDLEPAPCMAAQQAMDLVQARAAAGAARR
jgi:hypothetical protein